MSPPITFNEAQEIVAKSGHFKTEDIAEALCVLERKRLAFCRPRWASPDSVPDAADRLYRALALCDTRDGSPVADVVRAAREGYERSSPDMSEPDAWSEFDRLIHRYNDG